MGLLDFVKKAGSGIVHGIDIAAYNSAPSGLLSQGLPQQPTTGLLAPTQYDDEGNPIAQASPITPAAPQKWQPTPQQQHNMRAQFLGAIGSAIAGNKPLGEGLQEYRQNVQSDVLNGRALQQQQAKQQATQAFQQEMQAAAGNLPAQQQILLKYSTVLGPQETKAYQDVFKGMEPPKPAIDKVVGSTSKGIDAATGKPALLLHTESGKTIPVAGYTPEPDKIENLGNGVMFDPSTGRTSPHPMNIDGKPATVILDTRKQRYEYTNGDVVPQTAQITPYDPGKDTQYETVNTDKGIVRVPKTGADATATPLVNANGQPLKPFRVPRDTTASDTAALDRETTRFAKPYEKQVADAAAQIDKIDEARTMINGNASAQALGIPKVLTAVVSGAGSGVRITQPELNALGHARGIEGDVQGWISKVSGHGTLTPIQQQQISGVLDGVKDLVAKKRAIANGALDQINGAHTREEIVAVDAATRKLLEAGGASPTTSTGATIPGLPAIGQQFNGGKVLSIKRIN